KSSFEEMDLPNFIGQILGQYQDLLVNQVERDIKSKALAAVKEEAGLLQNQAQERLHLMESEVQQRVQAILDRARERIFEMVRDEMEDVFGELSNRFQNLLDDPEINVSSPAPGPTQEESSRPWDFPRARDATVINPCRLEDGVKAEPTEPVEQDIYENADTWNTPESPVSPSGDEVYSGTVKLRVEANKSPRQVVQFVDALRQKPDFRLLQLVGNYKEGVGIWLGLKAPLQLKEVLLRMNSVTQVETGGWVERDSHEPMLNVRLEGAALAK
ncbi:MAG: hypothetical protein ACE5JL_05335, partial [Dehalococcoidia bacterium]